MRRYVGLLSEVQRANVRTLVASGIKVSADRDAWGIAEDNPRYAPGQQHLFLMASTFNVPEAKRLIDRARAEIHTNPLHLLSLVSTDEFTCIVRDELQIP